MPLPMPRNCMHNATPSIRRGIHFNTFRALSLLAQDYGSPWQCGAWEGTPERPGVANNHHLGL